MMNRRNVLQSISLASILTVSGQLEANSTSQKEISDIVYENCKEGQKRLLSESGKDSLDFIKDALKNTKLSSILIGDCPMNDNFEEVVFTFERPKCNPNKIS